MSAFGLSSLNFYGSLRMPVLRVQSEIDRLQQEVSSGRRADAGRQLGGAIAIPISLRNDLTAMEAHVEANNVLASKLDATQSALGALAKTGQDLQKQLIAALAAGASATSTAAVRDSAKAALAGLTSTLNTSFSGKYLFAGQNTDVKPIADYNATPTSAAKSAVDLAFTSAFGVAPGSAGASAISGAAMKSFLDTQFANLFGATKWSGTWSQASDTPQQDQISPTQTIDTSVSANESSVRNLAQAFTMVSNLGVETMGVDARNAVITKASELLGRAIDGIISSQARMGISQNSLSSANDMMSAHTTYLKKQIGGIENIDPAQAATQLTALTTQLQSAYSLTSRISQLSLLKFL